MKEIILNTEYTYSQICEAIGWKVTTGNSKKAQIKEIESSFEFYHPMNKKTHKEKKSYIFTKQLKDLVEPSVQNNGGSNNNKNITPMMDYLLRIASEKEFFRWSPLPAFPVKHRPHHILVCGNSTDTETDLWHGASGKRKSCPADC